MSRLVASFVPKMHRAIMKGMETKVLSVGPNAQTASNANNINGGDHRFIGTGPNEQIAPQDFAKALFSLQMANVPLTNLIAIVDPSVAYTLQTATNLVNLSNNPRWEGVIRDGAVSGTKFLMNVYGFDVYVSQNLKKGVNETITPSNGVAKTSGAGVANLFFSAAPDLLPFIGQVRQQPKVDSKYNQDLQREEYVTTARYDFALFRPENLVTIITDTDQV